MTHQEFTVLVSAILNGAATPEQTTALAEMLRSDTVLRAEYVQQMQLDAWLRFTGGAALRMKGLRPASSTKKRFPFSWQGLAAVAAVFLAAVSLFWWTHRGVEVEIVQATDVARDEWKPGSRLRLGSLTLDRGAMRMRLRSGVLLDVVAPAEMEFVDDMHIRVSLGQITADVGEQGKGFIVETNQARIVDLGTKFGVDATTAGHTDVVVFQGEVELVDRSPGHLAPTRLVEGEAVRVQSEQLHRIVNVTSTAPGGEWSTRESAVTGVIATVRDNLRDTAARNYYRIVTGGLQEDARAFVGQRHEWNGLNAPGLPSWLLGADLVQTFMNDRFKTELEITVTFSRPAVVYVLADSRFPAPPWLTARFTDTGTRIGLENAPVLASGRSVATGPGAGNMAPFAVWKCELPQAGSITLGPPRIAPDQRLLWMYGIAAKPL